MALRQYIDEEITPDDLKSMLLYEIAHAEEWNSADNNDDRAKAIDYYNGDMSQYLASKKGRSKVVSRDVADTVDWMMPGLMRLFTLNDHTATYSPAGRAPLQWAHEATVYANYVFNNLNFGYQIIYEGTFDSLLYGDAIVKTWWDDTEECEYEVYVGMTANEYDVLLADPNVEEVSKEEGEPFYIDVDGDEEPDPIPTIDVKIKRILRHGRIRIECIEPENFLINEQAKSIEEARLTAQRREVTRSDLVEMGFDVKQIKELPGDHDIRNNEEALARYDTLSGMNNLGDPSTDLMELFECYYRVDINGDGVSETIRAHIVGNGAAGELLGYEIWEDESPFDNIPCMHLPHKFGAKSIYDSTCDIQEIKTALLRGSMDNVYATNLPQMQAEQNSIINPDALQNPQFGQLILRRRGRDAVTPLTIPFVAQHSFKALEYMDTVNEKRTGVSRQTMALDPDALQNQTATAANLAHDSAYSRIELVGRNQANFGWVKVFRKILKIAVRHEDTEVEVKLNGKPFTVTPSNWNAHMDVTVEVGRGTGSRERDIMSLRGVLQDQAMLAKEYKDAGLVDKAIGMLPYIRKTLVKLVGSSGLNNPEDYYPEIEKDDVDGMIQMAMEMAQRPDPEAEAAVAKVQSEIQATERKLDMELRSTQQRLDLERERNAQQIQQQRDQAAAQILKDKSAKEVDQSIKSLQIDREFQLKEAQMVAEFKLKERQMDLEFELKEKQMDRELALKSKSNGSTDITDTQFGGEVG